VITKTPKSVRTSENKTHQCLIKPRGDASDLVFLHRDEHATDAYQQLSDLIRAVLLPAIETGHVRDDVPLDVLVSYCLSALAPAGRLKSEEAVRRLVAVTLGGLRPEEVPR
jgi:hypothetical protein